MNVEKTVKAVNDSDYKVYLAVTGGGTQFIGDFLRYGGGSETILGFHVPYSKESFDDFIGYEPEKYSSVSAAESLALASYIKANKLREGRTNLGIGVSCSLTKGPDERVGRKNVAYISVVADDYVANHEFDLKGYKDGTRQDQEELVSYLILGVLARNTTPQQIVLGETVEYEMLDVNNRVYFNSDKDLLKEHEIVFPGSFNPFHFGHNQILEDVERITDKKVYCELSVENADKRVVLPSELAERIFQFKNESNRELLVVNAPKFNDKVKLYPEGTTFVVGADTFERILSMRYDDYTTLYNWVYRYDAEFVVIPRDGKDWKSIVQHYVDTYGPEYWYGSYERLGINPLISKYQENIDKGNWPVNVSSTQIRNGELINE